MLDFTRAIRVIRMRFSGDRPPAPLGCRWCGHSPYAHDDRCLPHRQAHGYERPTPAQFRARLAEWWRLGFAGRLSGSASVRPPGEMRAAPGQARPAESGSLSSYGRGRPPDGGWRAYPGMLRQGKAA
ncbi:hypothetical protein AB0K21_18070 [Streptosporangium sp. NPDC049248]|uniref:hypothetical protein n=1 Tax=Streptosporangium sp. NPDC049248 TaxID=3155651 RepID=UPI00343009E3